MTLFDIVLGVVGLAVIIVMWRASGVTRAGRLIDPSEPVDLPGLLLNELGQDFEIVQMALKNDRSLLGGRRTVIDGRTVIEFTVSSERQFTHRETGTMVRCILVNQPGLDCPYMRLSDPSESDVRGLAAALAKPPAMQFEVRGSWVAAHRFVTQFEGEKTLIASIESCLKVAELLVRSRQARVVTAQEA